MTDAQELCDVRDRAQNSRVRRLGPGGRGLPFGTARHRFGPFVSASSRAVAIAKNAIELAIAVPKPSSPPASADECERRRSIVIPAMTCNGKMNDRSSTWIGFVNNPGSRSLVGCVPWIAAGISCDSHSAPNGPSWPRLACYLPLTQGVKG